MTGRCKPFDELLSESRAAKEPYLQEKKAFLLQRAEAKMAAAKGN